MKKRFYSLFLVIFLLIELLPFGVSAANAVEDANIIFLDDGSYIEISIEPSSARVANTVSGSKKYVCRNSNDSVLWEAKLSATFAYSGGWYTCTTANCNVTIYDSQWYEISNSTVRSSNHATARLTMGRKYLGVTIDKPEYTITLTCDQNGNLS